MEKLAPPLECVAVLLGGEERAAMRVSEQCPVGHTVITVMPLYIAVCIPDCTTRGSCTRKYQLITPHHMSMHACTSKLGACMHYAHVVQQENANNCVLL